MLQCPSINASSASSSIPGAAGNSTDGSPSSSVQQSPTFNLTQAYLSIQTTSYHEILSRIRILDPHYRNHDQNQVEQQVEEINEDKDPDQLLLSQLLRPNRESVKQALRLVKVNSLSDLFSTSFDHSEKTTNLCLQLLKSLFCIRTLYAPVCELLDNFPLDHHSVTQSQCDNAFEVFLQFDSLHNPFHSPDSRKFHEMHRCFSDLKQKLDKNLQKSRSRVCFLRYATAGSSVCIIGTAVGVTIATVGVATHAIFAIFAGPLCTACFPRALTKKELANAAQLDAARKGAYVLNKCLDTIDRLVARLCTAIEGDKQLVRLGLGGGKEKHSIQEVVKQLRKNQPNFASLLKDLEEHICLCFKTVIWARTLLLDEINPHQTPCP
ncbi:UPF0496 protein [Citrus sinensis]|uniref:UPF0496 protein At3g19330-like n=1 Tax=Citrus sinensis TaxID=2711 RepID=UPI00218D6225|nr:UPF0496 protein At3g19330-like [Citrus sinensis]KAH9743123.1 UPF0496 protein [Citrus sinensis]